MKDKIIQMFDSRIEELGLKRTESKSTDIYIKAVLIDASFKSGSNRIEYEVNALIDEKKRTIFLYELLKESGKGFSYGTSFESTLQSGLSVMKKVKSTKYGIDGKAYDFEFNIGVVSKIFREIAEENKYQLKIVLYKKMANYFDPEKKSLFQKIFKK